ncbi:outer membrane beta-barrel family protein [Maribacter aurantiacus]|uniref:TonB-dependent receptor n=1 Tax=Maribacter aurantiacus TaxID=1882343 RepID=A0A5R8MAF6_9FLAO|nr:outer membrane beta-barrel family protein [Maribacter aurantiacus]TLF46541.1 TonB-dependent receptor [Maribacter aurantiacus]
MKPALPLLFFMLLISISINGQEFEISGSVKDQNGDPLVFANVLLKNQDSILIQGAATDESGLFILNNVEKGIYLISASYLDNTSETRSIQVSTDLRTEDLIILQTETQLDEVEVVYKKPTIEQLADRLIFNVENTSLSQGNIWNILKQTPGVIILNDKINIKGSSNIGVMINGRLVNIPQADIVNLLSGSSGDNVESVEVILNPPAKYSAEGGLLLDIKMKKNLIAGYNGSVYNRYTQAVFPKHIIGTDHFFKGKKTDFSLSYSFRKSKDLRRFTDITNFFDSGAITDVWTTEQRTVTRSNEHNINGFFDYQVNDKNSLSFSTINSFTAPANRFIDSSTLIEDTSGDLLSSFLTVNDSDYDALNSAYYLDWTHKFNKKGEQISLASNYTYYQYNRGQDLDTDFFDSDGILTGDNDFTTQSNQKTAIYSAQVDYNNPIKKTTTLETGMRYSGINSQSTIGQTGFDRTQPGIDPTEAGVFDYDEKIMAGYASLNNNWDTWQLNMGLRSEYTETIGDLDTASEPNKNSYLELFPSVSAQHDFKNKHNLALRYYRRITRPRYSDLNPFQFFQSNNTVVEGNPNLRPAIRNYVSLEYGIKRDYSLEVYYFNDNNDFFEQVVQDNESNLLRFLSVNLESNVTYGAEFRMNKRWTGFWDTYLLLTYYNKQTSFRDIDSGAIVSNGLWTGNVRFNNYFTLLKNRSLYADVLFRYSSPMVLGNSRRESTSQLILSLSKTFWQRRAVLSFSFDDVFNDGNFFYTRNYLNQDNSTFSRRETRLFYIGFRYRFGNNKIRDNQKRKSTDEGDRI